MNQSNNPSVRMAFLLPFNCFLSLFMCPPSAAQEDESNPNRSGIHSTVFASERVLTDEQKAEIKAVVGAAFSITHDGWSSDEVVIRDEINNEFIGECKKSLPDVADVHFNWTLLNLRKAGKLKSKATKRNSEQYESLNHVAEIVTRSILDKYRVSTDMIMADPKLRNEFDQLAKSINRDVDCYQVRKTSLRLRKSRRLRPELITRVADWDREVLEFAANRIAEDHSIVPTNPGVYIFRDKTGYLYIGESNNLRVRLSRHLDESDSQSLASYLREQGIDTITVEVHSFDPDSRAKEKPVRRAYESELIRFRKPKFNIKP